MLYITRKATFSASHRLYNPEFSEERNEAVFDKCNNVHGHNYTLELTVAGVPAADTGYVVDLKILKAILDEEIIDKVDHQHLNDVSFMRGIIPTAENLAVMFWQILERRIPAGKLYSLKLFESDNNFVEYRGEPITIQRYNYEFEKDAL